MNKYLILYGDDGSFFFTDALSVIDAVFALAKYTGNSFSPTYEKALNAMDEISETIELYNRFVAGYDEIQAIYKVDSVLYNKHQKIGD